ncbi:hypothetical protein ABIB62_000284 [Mucilaginibacter sp. UYP25]|uniref:hypothetical protein n=1 Tax=unclassified Mucilaginibacter TaxID=2617802 RepID=UPI00339510A2
MSILAFIISIITMYYQFFNVSHEMIYTFLTPSVNEKIIIPMIYKNEGNQNEMLLEANIELEVIPNDTTKPYFKRIGDENIKSFPIVVAPGQYKSINLIGEYKDYSNGMMEYKPSGPKYRAITKFDSLQVFVTTKFITDDGIAETRRLVGQVSFLNDMTFDRFEYKPIKLLKLEGKDKGEMISGIVANMNYSDHFKMSDTLTPDQIEHVKFMMHQVTDTTIKKALIRLLEKNHAEIK